MERPLVWRSRYLLAIPATLALAAAVVWGIQFYLSRPAHLLAKGLEAVERGDLLQAYELADSLEENGSPESAHLLRGKALVYAGETAFKREAQAPPSNAPPRSLRLFQSALDELAKVPEDGPAAVEREVLAAECLTYLQQQRVAVVRLKRALERDPENLVAHRLLAAIYMDLNDPKEAIVQFQAWARLEPANGLPYRWVGFFKKDFNEAEGAVSAYKEALKRELAPEVRSAVLKELAQTYCVAEEEYQAALDTIALGPPSLNDDPEILALRADCLRNLPNRSAEAVALLEKGLQQDPDNPRFLLLRAQCYLADDQLEKALLLLEKAAQRDPYELKFQTLLVDVYRQLKKDAQADEQKRHLEAVQKERMQLSSLIQESGQQPWNDRLRVEIARLCAKMNNPEQARTWLRAALTCNPDNEEARQLLSQVPQVGTR
jgi:predicted Zn-dependent protease